MVSTRDLKKIGRKTLSKVLLFSLSNCQAVLISVGSLVSKTQSAKTEERLTQQGVELSVTQKPNENVNEEEDNGLSEEGIVNINTSPAKSKTDELVQTLEKARKKAFNLYQGYPDPDNIATSLALGYMATQFEIQSTIVHFEQISHHENRALVKKLDLDIEEYSDQFDYSGYDYFAINDSQNTELPIKLPDTCELLVFVDHHKRLGTVKGHFVDIRESVGSTSAIYGEYLRDPRFNFSGDSFEESKIATASDARC